MKVLLKLTLVALVLTLMVGVSFATIVDDVLMVPKTETAPTIDGEMDAVWWSVSETRMLTMVDGIGPDNWWDYWTAFRVMWDDDNFYFFGKVFDDEISTSSANDYENDCFEIYFDGENLKNEGSYISGNDVQWRWVYDIDGTADAPNSESAWMDTDYGYNVEIKIPAGDLTFDLEDQHVFGFEVQGADRDNETREVISKWWSDSNDSWVNPALFGTAQLDASEKVNGDAMNVYKAPSAPEIDGEMDECWVNIPEIPCNVYVDQATIDLTLMETWDDFQATFRSMWNEDGFYIYVSVVDDEISTSSANDYENDCIEVYFDAENLKNEGSYISGNDIQWRWVYNTDGTADAPNSVAGWGDTDLGYDAEIFIPAGDLMFDLEAEHVFGYEIQVADRDNESRENILKWWSDSNDSWVNPALFGTAKLDGGTIDVDMPDNPAKATNFSLDQNYPNPFNPTTSINYSIADRGAVKLMVYDLLGQEVATLVNEVKNAGTYVAQFNGTSLTSGVYFYRLETGSDVITKKMMLVK